MEFNNVCMLSNVKQNEYISEDVFPKMNTLVQYFIAMCSSRMYPHPPQGTFTKIPRGRGVSKVKTFKGKYEAKPKFPGGWTGIQTKNFFMGLVWILSGTTQWLSVPSFMHFSVFSTDL